MRYYETDRIGERLHSITEDISGGSFPILIYLVVGDSKAALVDTGFGSGNLREVVESITKLPIVVLHTHAHLDHIGADSLFDELYLDLREIRVLREGKLACDEGLATSVPAGGSDYGRDRRLEFAGNWLDKAELKLLAKDIVPTGCPSYKAIGDGAVVDLGGISLRAISTPGHSPGSLSYFCEEERFAFTGDGIADIHWFDGQSTAGVEEFLRVLDRFASIASSADNIFAAHMRKPFGRELVNDLREASREILAGSEDAMENADYLFLKHGDLYAHRRGLATIYYDLRHIRRAPLLAKRRLSLRQPL
jgi:glyoxylase-like metal-dependent hydrolase (beta-lactamase superfamily II)